MGEPAQGAICRSHTTKDSECLTSSCQTLGEWCCGSRKIQVDHIIINNNDNTSNNNIIFPTYVSFHLGQKKQAMPGHYSSSLRLLFFPIPPAGGIRLELYSAEVPLYFASVSAQNLTYALIPEPKMY